MIEGLNFTNVMNSLRKRTKNRASRPDWDSDMYIYMDSTGSILWCDTHNSYELDWEDFEAKDWRVESPKSEYEKLHNEVCEVFGIEDSNWYERRNMDKVVKFLAERWRVDIE